MLKNCVNVKSTEFQDLLEESKLDVISLASKISHWQDINGVDNYPTLEQLNILPNDIKPNEVQYQLKVVNALQRVNRNTFSTDKLQGWINDLKKFGVTDQQVEIFKQYAKDGMTRDEIMVDIASNFGFSIEINLSTLDSTSEPATFTFNGDVYNFASRYEGLEHFKNGVKITQDEYIDAYDKFIEENPKPTQHYSNLTSPGVINYIEKAIVTPEIENIASEHTEDFNQGKPTMIGWSRMGEVGKNIQTVNRIDTSKLSSEEVESAMNNMPDNYTTEELDAYLLNKYGNRIREITSSESTNTRVILEIQSGIFQDFRDKENIVKLIEFKFILNGDEYESVIETAYYPEEDQFDSIIRYYKNGQYISTSEMNIAKDEYIKSKGNINNKNAFLQLLNKDNNWVRFFIKTTIQDAVKNGYKKIWFPQGETAAKIEGHQVIANRLADIDKKINQASDTEVSSIYRYGVSIMYLYKNNGFSKDGPAVWTTNIQDITNKDILSSDITYNKHGVEFTYLKEGIIDHSEFIKSKETHIKELEQEKQELKSQGIAKLAPIEHFYGNVIYNILKKNYIVNKVTDEYGNGWYEVELNEERDKEDILLNLTSNNINNSTDEKNHIKVYSKAKSELGRELSNFAHTPFIYNELEFASVEAWWHWYKLSNAKMTGLFKDMNVVSEEELDHLRTLDGPDVYRNGEIISLGAKSEGSRLAKKYEGLAMASPNKAVLKPIYYLKLANSARLKDMLVNSTLPFYHYKDNIGDYMNTHYQWTADLWDEIRSELKGEITSKTQVSNVSMKGKFEDIGKGTKEGDGKDKAMREIADSFVGEVINKDSSSYTSAVEIGSKSGVTPLTQGNTITVLSGDVRVVMLARNGELKNKPLSDITKASILRQYNKNAEFVVGDMPGVDSQFIDYLTEIGAKFTIYHTGTTSRIQLPSVSLPTANLPGNPPIVPPEQLIPETPTKPTPTIVRPTYNIETLKSKFSSYISQGFYTAGQQDSVINSIVYQIKKEYFKNNKLNVVEAHDKIKSLFQSDFDNNKVHLDYVNENGFEYDQEGLDDLANNLIYNAEDLQKRNDNLQVVLNNFDQLYQRALLRLDEIGLNVKGDIALTNEDGIYIESEDIVGEEAIFEKIKYNDKARFEINPKSTSSFKFKMWLSTIPNFELVKSKHRIKKNYLGHHTYIDMDNLYNNLLLKLADTEVILGEKQANGHYTGLLGQIKKLAKNHYEYQIIFNDLINPANSELATEFVNAMSNHYHTRFSSYNTKKYNKDREVIGRETRFLDSNTFSGYKGVIDIWFEYQKSLPIVKEDNGALIIDIDEVHKVRNEWNNYIRDFDKHWEDTKSNKEARRYSDYQSFFNSEETKLKFQSIMNKLGIKLQMDTIDDAFENSSTIFTGELGKALRLENSKGTETSDSFISYIFNAFEPKEIKDDVTDEGEPLSRLEYNNPLYGPQSERTIRNLATLEYINSGETSDLGTINGKGDLEYNISQYTYIANVIRKLRQPNSKYLKQVKNTLIAKSTKNAKGSKIIEDLESNPEYKKQFKIIYFDASRERNRNREYKSREDMDKSDQTNDAITAFYNNNSKIGWYFMMTHYNNTLAPMIPVVKTNFKLQFDKETFNIPNEALDAVMRQVMAEVHRIEAIQEMGDTIFPDYNIAAHYFLMFPYLNPSVLSKLVEAGKLTQEEMDSIWTPKEDGDKFFKLNTSKTGLNTIRKIVNNVVLKGINDTINEWLEFGILKQNQNGTLTSDQIDINYIKQIESVDHSVKNIAAEFYVNTLIAYTEMYRVIYGDPAIYAKVGEDIDKNGIVNQQATEAFMQKRFKGAISPHMIGNWKKQSYNRITINDRKIDLEIESYLKHLDKDAYHKINTTDGLEYTTTREAIEAKRAYGKISDKEADKLIAKIDKAYSLDPSDSKYGYYEFDENEISIILGQNKFKSFTPYFHEQFKMMMIDFTKSSDINLLPQFTKNMELDRLRRFMEENDIDRASSASADKMGTIKTFPFWHSSNGGLNPSLDILIETFKSDRNSFVRTLSREDMGMQQELPQGKKEIAVSTQLDGHLFLNARNLEGFKYKGKSNWTGKDLERAKMDINISLMKLGKDQVEKDLGISYDATGKMLITDLNKVKTLLEEEANKRHWITQDIKGLTLVNGELMVPMFFNNSDKRIQALLLSIITNNIIKHKQPGTGFTQIPQAGLRPTNIVTKDEINLKDYGIVVTDSYDIEKGLQPIGEVEAAQVFVTWDFKDPQGNDLLMSDFINKETGRIDPKKLPKNVLQLISFRIPGQGHNSGLPIEIVGFIPKESKYGDVIVVPDTITKQMGSDFDIDKLYSYITAYYYNKIDKSINKIHDQDEIYKNNTKDDLTAKLQDISNKLDKISKVKLNINTILTSVKYEKVSKEYDVDDMLSLIRSGEAVDNAELQEALDDIKNMIEDEKDLKEELKDLNNTVRLLEEERFEAETKLEILDQFTPESLLKQDYKDIHWAVFTHPGMLKYIINPLENEDLATEQERIVRPTQHYINTFTYQRDSYIEQIQSADQIAPFALSLKLHSLIENIPVNYYAKNAKGKWVPAKFTGFKKNGAKESLELTKFNGEGISYFDDKKDKAHTRTVHDNINIQLSGAVDSKNQSNVGINKHTTPVSIIISIFQTANSEALDFRYNTRFLSQQAIKIYCYYVDANLRNTSEDYFPSMKEVKTDAYLKAKEHIEKYISNHEYEQTDDYKKMSFSPDDMRKLIDINMDKLDKTEDYYIAQSKILDLYRELDYIADIYIAKRKAILSPMSNGPGINFASANKLQELVSNIDKNKTLNGIEKALDNTDSGFAAHEVLDFAVELGNVLNPELKVFSDILRVYEYVTGEDELSDKAISTLLTRYKQSFYSGRADLYGVNDVNFERARLLFNAVDNVSHARMIEAYNEETKYSNKYTSKLRVKKAKEAGKPDTLRFNELRGVNIREEQLVSTIDMLIDPNQKIRELMQDNAEAAYILGNVNGVGSFNKNIPLEYLEEVGFNKALRNIHKDLINKRNEADIEIFIRDLFKHEPWRGKPLDPKFINKSLSSIKVGNFPAVFTLKTVAEVPEVSQIMITRENHVFYPEFINFYNENTNTWLLFEKIGTFSGSPVYQVTDTKGEANAKKTGVYEFDYNGSPYSIFKENQVPQIKDVIPLDNQEIEIRHTQAVEDDEIIDDVPDLDEEVYNITQGSLAGMIEDKFNNMSNDGKSSYITILRNLQGSQYDNLLSEIIQRKLTEQGATFKGEIDRNLNTSAKTLFKGNVVKGIKFNPSKILNEFHRQQFPNTNDYLNASLNANILHEGTHAILIPITRSKEANSSKVNAILSSLERIKEQTINELEKKYPGLKEDIKLFQQAVEKAKEGTLSNEDLNNISNPMAYYLSNLDEFMVGVLNNRQLQRELNDIIVGEKSLLEKFIDYLSTLFEYLAEELGIKINDSSALRVAIENVIALQDLPIVDNTEEQELFEEMNNIYAETEIRPEHKALIERLNTNIRILNDKYTGALKPEERLDIEQEIQRLEQSRDYILEQQDAETIKKAGVVQLKYADFISLKQNATLRELYNVLQIADTWKLENTKEFMADEIFNDLNNDHRKVFGLLSSRAEVIENRVLDKLTAYFANETSNRRRVNISYSPEELQQIINDPNAREGLELTFALKSGEFKPFINGNPIDTFKSITTGTFETNPEILKKTKAIGFWQAMALSTDINDNPIGQTVVSYIDGAARNKDEMIEKEYKEFDKQLEKIKNPTVAAKIGKNYHIFRQLDGKDYNGRLTSSYSSLWHHLLDIDREEINKAKFANEHSGTSTTKENLANAWKLFYTKRRKASITIDLRFFFRPNFKTTNEGYKFNSQKEYITYLEKEFGKEIAEEHILEAKNRYAKYQQELDYQTKAVESNSGIPNKQGYIDKWRMEHDPLLALDIIYGKEGISNEQIVNNKSEWTLNVARRFHLDGTPTGYYDKNYEIIMSDPDLREFYKYYINTTERMLKFLPKIVTKYRPQNLLAHVQKELHEIASERGMIGAFKYTGKKGFDSLGSKEVSLLRYINNPRGIPTYPNGDPYQKLPYYFMETPPKGGTPLSDKARQQYFEEQSEDLEVILKELIKMAYTFDYKNQVQDIARVGLRLHKQAGEIVVDNEGRTRLDSMKRVLGLKKTNTASYEQLKYYVDAMLYDQRKDKGKQSNIKLGVAWTKEARQNKKRELELESLRDKLEEDLMNDIITVQEYESKMSAYEEEYKLIARKNLVWGKAGDKILTYTQLKGLGLNLNSGFANLGFGLITNMMHANGRVDFDNKSLMKAFSMMFSVMKWKSVQGKKITKMIHNYRILFDVDESKYGEDKKLIVKMWNKKLDPYVFQTKTEFYNQGLTFLSYMMHHKIMSKNGEISLFDAYDNNGDWRTELFDDETNRKWNSQINATTMNDYTITRNRVIQLNKALHGNYDPSSPIQGKKYLLGRALSQFRSWIPEGVESRFGEFRWDDRIGRYREGRYKTFAHLGLINSLKTLGKQVIKSDEAFVHSNGKKFMPWEIENMRRNLAEIGMAATMASVALLLKLMLNYLDDDDDPNSSAEEKAIIYSINILQRVQADISFYLNPNTFTSIIDNPIAAIKTYKDFRNAMVGTYKHLTDSEYQGEPSLVKWSKAFPYTNQVPKFMYLTERRMAF